MFAETVARVSGAPFGPPIVLCGESHAPRVRAALTEIDTRAAAIVIEPAARNTAAVAASAAAVAQELDRGALVLLLPSDHVITNVASFHAAIENAARFARDRIVTFGMTPTHAATGYGYIKRGGALGEGVFAIEAFKEKPQGDGAWINGGYFVLNRKVIERIDGDDTVFEHTPMRSLAHDGQLHAWRHAGFWQPMDTLRDKHVLEELWESGKAPWKKW